METSKSSKVRQSRRARNVKVITIALATVAMFTAIYFAGRLGANMAQKRLPDSQSRPTPLPESTKLTLGELGNPIFLGSSPNSLRKFFSAYSSSDERASADTTGRGIRRLQGSVEVSIMRTEADAIEVRITSGTIAGGVYWIHHSQIPDSPDIDPIISPIPGSPIE
tara:strand:+ start:2082 stop:2579 length:498 start_codon:yes stop_codon:yes gene_type:complete